MASFRKKNNKWEARISRRGTPTLSKTFETKDDAERWARRQEVNLDQGKTVKRTSAVTLNEAAREYLKAKKSDLNRMEEGNLRTCTHDLGLYQIDKLSREILNSYIKKLLLTPVPPAFNKHEQTPTARTVKTYASSTVRKIYYSLKACIIWHSETKNHALPENLFSNIALPGAWDRPRDRRLNPGEEEALLEAAKSRASRSFSWPRIILFALETGLRQQEIALAKWSDITPSGKGLCVPRENSKTKKERIVSFSLAARALISELKENCPKNKRYIFWEFEGSAPTISTNFRKLVKSAQLTNLTFHDLRHEALARLASKGTLTISELMSISGHDEMRTFSQYLKFFPDALADKMG